MKKFVAVFAFLVAFTVSANAQDQRAIEVAAKADADALTEYLGLTGTIKEDFNRLFIMKHEVLSDKNLSQDRKDEMSRQVGLKIMSSLNADQTAKLNTNVELLNSLKGPMLRSEMKK